jgi:hypothetical protein
MHKTLLATALAVAVAAGAPAALAQPACDDISDQCLTTDLLDCVDAVGESVTVQIGGPGAEDADDNGGTCWGIPATALITFTKSAADELQVEVKNTTCDDSTLTAVFFNISTTVTAMAEGSPFTDPDPTVVPWNLGYSQTTGTNDGFGFKAAGFGNFDAVIYNGDNPSPTGGNPNEILSGDQITFTIDVSGGYDLCDLLAELSQPPPGEMNRSTVGRYQSCGTNGDSAFIGPCTGDDDLLAVIADLAVTPGDHRVRVDWRTSLEIDNAGFNVLRRATRNGGWQVVNPQFLPAAGDSVTGAEYRFEDATALNGVGYDYRIEDIDFRGVNGLSPIRSAVANPADPDVRLQAPSYGATAGLDRNLRFAFEAVRVAPGIGRLQVSADPSFEGTVVEQPVSLRNGPRSVAPSPRTLAALQEAAGSGGVLYWRVADRTGKPISNTFLMEVQ